MSRCDDGIIRFSAFENVSGTMLSLLPCAAITSPTSHNPVTQMSIRQIWPIFAIRQLVLWSAHCIDSQCLPKVVTSCSTICVWNHMDTGALMMIRDTCGCGMSPKLKAQGLKNRMWSSIQGSADCCLRVSGITCSSKKCGLVSTGTIGWMWISHIDSQITPSYKYI